MHIRERYVARHVGKAKKQATKRERRAEQGGREFENGEAEKL